MAHSQGDQLEVFPTELGWTALVASTRAVRQLTFAHATAAQAVAALDVELVDYAGEGRRWSWLVRALQDFAAGEPVDLIRVPIEIDNLAPFQRAVVRACRKIPYGRTRSYGELATQAGSPRAARAAGTTMATNRLGLLVPCHRVINANGSIGSYGGPQGVAMKRRLLALERRGLAEHGRPRRPPAPAR